MSGQDFNIERQLRYSRHLVLPGFGASAQRRLLESSILVVGAGGLGSPAAIYLAAAGIGRIGIMDDDVVDLSNLQRQILHTTADIGRAKVDSAEETIARHNPDVRVEPMNRRLVEADAMETISRYDLVLDGADNLPTRYLLNDAAFFAGKPVVHGSVHLFEGQATVFDPPRGPCYRCLFPELPPPGAAPSCAEAGVLGVLPGIIGLVEATEAIKMLTGIGDSLVGRLLSYDAMSMTFRTLRLRRNAGCPLCGGKPTITAVREESWSCEASGGDVPQISAQDCMALVKSGRRHLLLDVREPGETDAGHISGSLLIPLGLIRGRLRELDPWRGDLIVCVCQAGVRSRRAAELLRKNGFRKAASMAGGYLAWLDAIRPARPVPSRRRMQTDSGRSSSPRQSP
jgi:adenylyltransferase/sulfurtransferase